MTPLTHAAVQALAQQAAEAPAHLDPTLVQQVCQEWEDWKQWHAKLCEQFSQLENKLASVEAERDGLSADLICGQLHGPSCPYQNGDEDSCTCRPEELASRWKAQWVLVKAQRDAACEALKAVKDRHRAHPESVWPAALDAQVAAALGLTQGEGQTR